jgi:hypothetical protein
MQALDSFLLVVGILGRKAEEMGDAESLARQDGRGTSRIAVYSRVRRGSHPNHPAALLLAGLSAGIRRRPCDP